MRPISTHMYERPATKKYSAHGQGTRRARPRRRPKPRQRKAMTATETVPKSRMVKTLIQLEAWGSIDEARLRGH